MRYGVAATVLLASAPTVWTFSSHVRLAGSARSLQYREFRLGVSAARLQEFAPENSATNITSLTATLSDAVNSDDDEEELEIAARRARITERNGSFQVTLPLTIQRNGEGTDVGSLLGMRLRQFVPGRDISDAVLNLDTMEFESIERSTMALRDANFETIDESDIQYRLEPRAAGVYVSSVLIDSAAWNAGIRAGDIVKSTGATFGDRMWPKSTLDGVQSSLSSRRMVAGSATFEFQRTDVKEDNVYELSLVRPIGLQLTETEEGYVEVVGFTEKAPKLVKNAVRVGDRVLAVDSSIGGQMWPVSTIEGVISACTSRLPGQQVTLRFQRPDTSMSGPATMESSTIAVEQQQQQKVEKSSVAVPMPTEDKELLSRCRDILRRYSAPDEQLKQANSRLNAFSDKFSVPAMVADKVMDALAKASATVDSVTLSMIMEAYLSCKRPADAIQAFEAIVGLNGNGSILPLESLPSEADSIIKPNVQALNIFTIGSLLRAHGMRRDLRSVRRVVAAMEGKSGDKVSGLEIAKWPGTGASGRIKPDSQCYNIAISAAAQAGGPEGMLLAHKLFESLGEPSTVDNATPKRNHVSYNAVISALTKEGLYDDAFDLFFSMKKAGVKPDKFTYTSLIKACTHEGDLQEMLYDMREQGVKDDVISYNTMIKSCCEDGRLTEARRLILEMESKQLSPDSKTYGVLMKGLLKAGKPGACITLFDAACASEKTSALTENVHLYTTAVTAASRLGDHDRALDLVSRMSAVGVKPNLKTLTALMGACLSSKRPDLAVQVYNKIDNPDGYAMLQGLRAMCEAGDIYGASALISTQRRGSRTLSGKQLMEGYSTIIESAIRMNDFDSARKIFSELLVKSFIPSKRFLQGIIRAAGLITDGKLVIEGEESAPELFRFLLFLIDSLGGRNLSVDGTVYAAALVCGNHNGGEAKDIAQLLIKAKVAFEDATREILPEDNAPIERIAKGWEEIMDSPDELHRLVANPELAPFLVVPLTAKDSRRVLFAEKALTQRPRRTLQSELLSRTNQ